MKNNEPIAKINFDMDPTMLETIMKKGKLEQFVRTATTIFRRDLMTQLVESDTSISTSLLWEDDDFGTGPRPPRWHHFERLDVLNERINALENIIVRVDTHRHF
jgi:hypothetical protein